MHYGQFADWVRERVEDLVGFGVPREEAEAMMRTVEASGVSAEARARSDRQFLLDFQRLGSVELGVRMKMSPQGVCKKRTRILSTLNSELNARLNCA